MNRFVARTLAAGLGLIAGAAALAQDLGHKAPPQTQPIAVANAMIHTVSGETIERGFVLFENGVIRQVGRAGEPYASVGGALLEIDASGKHVYPGLISAVTTLGLTEINLVRATRDFAEVGDVSPEVRAAVAVNPDSWHFPVARRNGVLLAGVFPDGGSIPGRASVIRMDGWTWEDKTVLDEVGVLVEWPNVRPIRAWWMTRSEEEQLETMRNALATIDEAFATARAYFDARKADPSTPQSVRWDAMREVIEGRRPVLIRAQELDQIQSAVSWAASRGYKAVIVGGRDAPLCADLLKKHDVGVIITGTHRLPRRADSAYDEAYTLPAELEKAGVRWCLSTGGLTDRGNDRNLPYHAAIAVAHGLDRGVAIRSITLSAAQLLGIGDRYGSLEPGKSATLIVTDGDPLDIRTNVERAYIEGRTIDLANKQTDLAEKYREKYRQLGLIPR